MTPLTNVIVSGGGTGGHIHPALAIADEIIRRNPEANVRFVGALGRMEMDKVPAAGYDIDGLWITGVERKLTSTRNLVFPFMLLSSLWKARRLLKRHRPQVVVGVGGFASGPCWTKPCAWACPPSSKNKTVSRGDQPAFGPPRASGVCRHARHGTLVSRQAACGHRQPPPAPRRPTCPAHDGQHQEALDHFGLRDDLPVVFVMGGSLGAVSMNDA